MITAALTAWDTPVGELGIGGEWSSVVLDLVADPVPVALEGGADAAESVEELAGSGKNRDEPETGRLPPAREDAVHSASTDSVRAYLRRIGTVALLTAEQEVHLANHIEAGLYAAQRLRQHAASLETHLL